MVDNRAGSLQLGCTWWQPQGSLPKAAVSWFRAALKSVSKLNSETWASVVPGTLSSMPGRVLSRQAV